ncbi:MAG: GNAT family N-acetyltransferase [Rickettsiaceae bacterium]|nr:GNAT family N-acetyltransferase [Rickettsiaceae bacterium]
MINTEERHMKMIMDILQKYPYSFYVFGSRAKDNPQKFSDLDLVVFDQVDVFKLLSIKEDFEESYLPYTVDVICWNDTKEDFINLIKDDLKLVQAGKNFKLAEKILYGKFLYLAKILDYDVKEDPVNCRINCGYNTSMFNIVCNTKFDTGNYKQQVDETIEYYKDQPFAWWLGASSKPQELGKYLQKIGLEKETDEYAMMYEIGENQQLLDIKYGKQKIFQVTNIKQLKDFSSILAKYDEAANSFYCNEKILSKEVMQHSPLFICYLNNVPVAIGSLYIENNIAGIFDLITNEEYRGQGIGTNMMKYLMNYAINQKVNKITLSASSDSGFKIYKKLGFNVIGMFECFEKTAT